MYLLKSLLARLRELFYYSNTIHQFKNIALRGFKMTLSAIVTIMSLSGCSKEYSVEGIPTRIYQNDSITYSLIFTGNGNNTLNGSFPEFSIDNGILQSIRLNDTVSLSSAYNLSSPSQVKIGRNDYISVSGVTQPFTSFDYWIKYFDLSGTSSVQVLHDNQNVTGQITNVGSFTGEGKVSFVYYETTYYVIPSGSDISFTDTVKLSLTYYYKK